MAIIELAHIQLKDGVKASDPDLLRNLKEVKRVIEEYSKLPTLFFEQADDPTVMYVIGAWPNKETHENGFNGSPQQAEILGLIKDQMGIDWMHYMDIDQKKIPVDSPVLALIKETLPKHINRASFDQDFAQATASLGGARYGAVGAWNLRKDIHEPDVRVHFTGWETVDEATDAITNTIANAGNFVVRPTNLFFFFLKKVNLD